MKKTGLPTFMLLFISFMSQSQQVYQRELLLMGCDFGITVVADEQKEADVYIQKAIDEITRIEKLISSWDVASQTSLVNKNAGLKPVKVHPLLFELIQHSLAISKLTDGAFDITFASLDPVWKFDGSMKRMPAKEEISASVSNIGFQNIQLNDKDTTVFLLKKGMKIGFGAIGKGFAADKAKHLLMQLGVTGGIINASGDLNVWGTKSNGMDWTVAITNPLKKQKAFAHLPIHNGAVATSGNYEKFVTIDGKKYSHIINPKTGYPSEGLVSVTVFSPKAELCDALATAIFVMGKEVGIDRINQLPKTECILIDEEGNVFTSDNIKLELQ
ncbi:FAD:protein FMN transferase [Carboxylicivirga linearis]|uniref:FAD:protein FMN transferase n=1 Tax=Carboxylicivirga linearis TaxID=1628157 RepID=A0ABS5JVA7_9BACT|nr:FAD:protein FMN transferase [Carboxylicivirga linearis]MBS2098401.1 FAD:protein FMN transferase [Carboxylicivirga linearis]